MVNLNRDIQSLTDFKRDTARLIEQMRLTGSPLVLTINGRAELVVHDATAFQDMLDQIERLETLAGIKEGLAAKSRGDGVRIRDAIERLAAKHDVDLDG